MAFEDSVKASLISRGILFSSFCDTSDIAQATILKEYGAVYLSEFGLSLGIAAGMAATVASTAAMPFPLNVVAGLASGVALSQARVKLPDKIIFENESEVTAFQSSLVISREVFGSIPIELQANAMAALKLAEAKAKSKGHSITPNQDSSSGRRSYTETVKFWNNKIKQGIAHWKANKNASGDKLTDAEATALLSVKGSAQIKKVLELEAKGFFFATNKKKTILRSVAAPGTSQHLLMLALDVKEHAEVPVRKILAEHGWFQTVFQDHPHFTYMGVDETMLGSLGLTMKKDAGHEFWVP